MDLVDYTDTIVTTSMRCYAVIYTICSLARNCHSRKKWDEYNQKLRINNNRHLFYLKKHVYTNDLSNKKITKVNFETA